MHFIRLFRIDLVKNNAKTFWKYVPSKNFDTLNVICTSRGFGY